MLSVVKKVITELSDLQLLQLQTWGLVNTCGCHVQALMHMLVPHAQFCVCIVCVCVCVWQLICSGCGHGRLVDDGILIEVAFMTPPYNGARSKQLIAAGPNLNPCGTGCS